VAAAAAAAAAPRSGRAEAASGLRRVERGGVRTARKEATIQRDTRTHGPIGRRTVRDEWLLLLHGGALLRELELELRIALLLALLGHHALLFDIGLDPLLFEIGQLVESASTMVRNRVDSAGTMVRNRLDSTGESRTILVVLGSLRRTILVALFREMFREQLRRLKVPVGILLVQFALGLELVVHGLEPLLEDLDFFGWRRG